MKKPDDIPQDVWDAATEAAMQHFGMREGIARAVMADRERSAAVAYRVCAEKRHVTLGDEVAAAIRGGEQP